MYLLKRTLPLQSAERNTCDRESRRKKDLVRRVNQWMRLLLPTLYSIFCVAFFSAILSEGSSEAATGGENHFVEEIKAASQEI
jgi:hypothetical protein